jgi:D-methionine transport system permease protein
MSAVQHAADTPWTGYLELLWQALRETLYMVALSALFTFVIGLLIGILLYVTGPGGVLANRLVYLPLGLLVNVGRSLPFLILLIVLLPVTRAIIGTSLGATAAIVPLTIGSSPFFGRVVETALREVDVGRIEAVQSMGATSEDIVFTVLLPEALPDLLAGAT